MSEISQTLKGSATENLSTVSQKNSTDIFISPPSVHKTFRYQKVVKHKTVPLRDFSLLWDKIYSTENHDIPPLMQKNFWCPKFPGTSMGSPDFYFGSVRQGIFDIILWYTPPIDKIFRYVRNYSNTERFPDGKSQHCVTENFDRESCYAPFVHKIYRYQKVLEHKKVPLRSFMVLWDKKYPTENHDSPPLLRNNFSCPKPCEILKGSTMKVFLTVKRKNLQKIVK